MRTLASVAMAIIAGCGEVNGPAGVSQQSVALSAQNTCKALATTKLVRTRGTPDEFNVPFALLNPAGGPFTLSVENHAVTSAAVALNGVQLLGPVDFARGSGIITRRVALVPNNLLHVRLNSAPGSYLLLTVLDADNTPPVVTIRTPISGLVSSVTPIAIEGGVDDTSASVNVNGQPVALSSRLYSAVAPLAEGANTITASASDPCGHSSSASVSVTLDSTPPALSAEVGQVCSGLVTVSGSARDATTSVSLTIEVAGSSHSVAVAQAGTFDLSLDVGNADSISIVAADRAGNVTRQDYRLDPVVCRAQDACHVAGSCDRNTRACTNPLADDGTSCNDGSACTRLDSCQSGVCVGADLVVCPASDQCHQTGACDPDTGACSDPPADEGRPCDDGSACTRTDSCRSGVCVGAEPVTCVASDPCHGAGACDPATGGCDNPVAPDGVPCNDGDACTKTDACHAGLCLGTDPVVCSASDQCHVDGACDPHTGTCSTPLRACDDNDPCTEDGCNATAGCVNVHTYGPACDQVVPPDDVTIKDFGFLDSKLRSGQLVTASLSLSAAADHPDYSVEFVLFPVVSDPEEAVEAVLVGAANLPLVSAGSSDHTVELAIPDDLAPGRYELAAREYPDGKYVDPAAGRVGYDIGPATALPTLALGEAYPDQQSFVLDDEGSVGDPSTPVQLAFSASVEVAAWDGDASRIPITAQLVPADSALAPLPLLLWNADQARYADSLRVESLSKDEPTDLYLDLALSADTADQLRATLPVASPVSATVVVSINSDGSVGEGGCSEPSRCVHTVEIPATIFVPAASGATQASADQQAQASAAPQAFATAARSALAPSAASPTLAAATTNTAPLVYEKNYAKFAHNRYVGIGVTFSARAQLSRQGFDGRAAAAIPYQFLSSRSNFAEATASTSAHWASSASYSYRVQIVGKTVLDAAKTDETISVPVDFPEIVEQTPTYQETVMIGPVPVTLFLGAQGTFDVTGGFNAGAAPQGATLDFSLKPAATLSAFGGAAVGRSDWGFAVGVAVDLNLIQADLTARAGGALEVLLDDNGVPETVRGSLNQRMDYDYGFLSGKIDLCATYPWLKCKVKISFKGVKISCGFDKKTSCKTLASWPGFHYGPYVLLENETPLFEIGIPCNSDDCAPPPDPDHPPVCGDGTCNGVEDCASCESDCGICFAGENVEGSGYNPGWLNTPSTLRAITDLAVKIVPADDGTITSVYFDTTLDISTVGNVGARYALLADNGGLPGDEISGIDFAGPLGAFSWPAPSASVSWPVTRDATYWLVLKENTNPHENCIFRVVRMNVGSGSWSGDTNAYARLSPNSSRCTGRSPTPTPWEEVENSTAWGAIGAPAGYYTFVRTSTR